MGIARDLLAKGLGAAAGDGKSSKGSSGSSPSAATKKKKSKGQKFASALAGAFKPSYGK